MLSAFYRQDHPRVRDGLVLFVFRVKVQDVEPTSEGIVCRAREKFEQPYAAWRWEFFVQHYDGRLMRIDEKGYDEQMSLF
jgi:hypothetical protein